jgi:hypothetical protein
MTPIIEVEENLPSGFKYIEETGRIVRSLPMRDCYLWQTGIDEPISGLNVMSFRQRFGAVAIPAEGIGGVETLPAFRRRGHMRTLLTRAIAGITKRVAVAFISDGIPDTYENFGFVNCLAEGNFSLKVREVERLANRNPSLSVGRVRNFSESDLPEMIDLYNLVHIHRSWTHERQEGWKRLLPTQTWQPGSTVIILEQGEKLAGYAIFTEQLYGHPTDTFDVDEMAAKDIAAGQDLLVAIAARCWELRFNEFRVREPLDSEVGKAAQRLGCTYHQTYTPGGGMMGSILDRGRLLTLLEPEFLRRSDHSDLHPFHADAFHALCCGEVLPDNPVLLQLLVGHWSMVEARASGVVIPERYERILEIWFPAHGTLMLPQPYSHSLDRY